ncbi:phosphodiesterase (plasmid) [Arthrobacter sp. ERGS1:01]|uniref:alkaline phosphatase family protein n=1 Tax=Arthrobacter sp. ERGS1:01 TaxID=1704044 RepID=UPI0006B67ECD|nr:alkaline phosphatase family protein [Arthrobacter sp. ERGS1:01]ALE04162.1 phosphodiesterase [Arthrobacter sp. ERGS1:01]
MNSTLTPRKRHVLVVGMDGIRHDSLLDAQTPVLDALARDGVLLPVRVHEKNYTVSGPVWSTVATGVYMDRHGVVGNSVHPPEMAAFPDFTARVRAHDPHAETMIAASWHPLAAAVECGPIFSSRGWVNEVDPERENNRESWLRADDEVADYAAGRLGAEDLAVSFVYFGEGDVEAHNHGTGPGYTACIERCDARLGRLVEAIAGRPGRADEDWSVIVVTDHGHLDQGGHGGESDEERTAWMVASGAGMPDGITALDHADIAAQVLATFGVPDANLDGVPFGRR